jgi:CheY-like chemotaxis protein
LPTWMVVEDEPDIYDVLLAMFEIWGIEGVAFVDGAEAVAWIEDVDKGNAVGELPELAILDIRLPEVPGPEVGARLRKSERLGKIAVVMITAYRLSSEEEEQVKARAQADTLMYKPLPAMPELRKILDHIIARRKAMPLPQPTPQAVKPTPPTAPQAATTPPKPAAQPTQPTQPTPPKPAPPTPSVQPGQPAAPNTKPASPPAGTKPSTRPATKPPTRST